MPQNRISICTSFSVGFRRWMVVEASGDVALAAENALALYMAQSYMVRRRYDMQNAPFYMQEAPCDSPHPRCAAFNQLNLWSVFAFYSPMRGIT